MMKKATAVQLRIKIQINTNCLLWICKKNDKQYIISYLKEFFSVFTGGQFWPSGIVIACECVYVWVCLGVHQSWACPHDNSSNVQGRITKFGPEMWKSVKQSSFISWWDHWSSMSHWLSDWHWILQALIGFRQIMHTSHAAILYGNIPQSQKQQ